MPRRLTVALLLLLLTLTLGSTAAAQPAPPPAAPTAQDQANYKRHFDTGKTLVRSQAFDVAGVEFETAYGSVKNADALRQALDCYKQTHAAAKQTSVARRLLTEQAKALKFGEKKQLEALIASLASSVGTLDVRSSEAGAALQVDGQDAGVTPLPQPLELDAGPHKVSLRKKGFEPLDKDVAVIGHDTVVLNATLETEILTGKVSVTEKTGATIDVVVDGNVVGPAPWQGDLPLGTHQISGHSPTMDAPAQSVEVVKRQPLAVALVAVATTGTLSVETADGKGVIYIDDKVSGEGTAKVDLPVGSHMVAVKREGYVNAEKSVDISAGGTVTLKLAMERLKPTGPVPRSYDVYEGIYGGLTFAGLLQANPTGNQAQRRCSDLGTACTLDTEKGGGVYGFIGYTWQPIGVDLFLGGSGDVSSPSATVTNGTDKWDVYRVGGLGAIRVRSMLQTHVVRVSLALGMGVAERVVGVGGGSSTDYTSLLGTGDLAFSLRTSATSAIAIGCMGFVEDAGQGAVVDVSTSRTPFYLFSGTQYLIEPYIGLQFGP